MSDANVRAASSAENEFKFVNELNRLVNKPQEFEAFFAEFSGAKSRLDVLYREVKEKERAAFELRRQEEERKRAEEERLYEEEMARLEAEEAEAAAAEAEEELVIEEPAEEAPELLIEDEPPVKAEEPAEETPEPAPEKEAEAAAAVTPSTPEKPTKPEEKPVPSFIRGKLVGASAASENIRSRTFTDADNRRPYRTQSPGGAPGAGGYQRPGGAPGAGGFKPRPAGAGGAATAPPAFTRPPAGGDRGKGFDKKKPGGAADEKKGMMNKRTLIRKGYIMPEDSEERMGSRKFKNKRLKEDHVFAPIVIDTAVITTENLTVKILSEKIGKTANEIIKQLMVLGIMANINSVVDFPTMELVANELGVELELRLEKTKEEELTDFQNELEGGNAVKRPPIVTVMGHVDHGKTSLLDAFRKTSVADGEAGGITQHIGAYTVQAGGEKITFVDTPGHEAFTAMRARGAQVTDIAIIVVAADDGVMPQTVEAISHVKAADVPIIVAINKMDKPQANIDRIKQQLTEHGLVPEEWGGDTMMVPVSAKQGINLDKLLDSILLVAEVQEFKADPDRKATGTIVEARLDKGRGPVATVIVQNGTLHVGDFVVAGVATGKVRAMIDDKGKNIKAATPSMPVSILGFTEVPNAGDILNVVEDERFARSLADERRDKMKVEQTKVTQKITLEDIFARTADASKVLNVIIKTDVQGSVEALKASLDKIDVAGARINVVHSGVGAINKSDIMLADASKSVVIGFNVKADNESKQLADESGIHLLLYKIIYEVLDDIEARMKGMLDPVYREQVTGHAEVRTVFKFSSVGSIAGSYVLDGKIVRNSKARVRRGDEVVFEGNLTGLKRFKDDAKEVSAGYECGISFDSFRDVREGDIIEVYTLERVN